MTEEEMVDEAFDQNGQESFYVSKQSERETEIEYIFEALEDREPEYVNQAYYKYCRKELAEARSKTAPEEVALSQGMIIFSGVDADTKFSKWYRKLHNSMLDVWDDFVLSNSPVLDQYDVPRSPSYLIPDDLKEPGFITMAIALDGLGRATNLSKKTSATNPYEAIKQAYGQELVSQANVLINFVKSGGGSEKVRDYCLYDNYSPFSNTGMDNDEKDKIVEDYNKDARDFNQSHGRVTEVK